MDENIVVTKKDIEDMKVLTEEEIKKLSFHELCLYLNMLDNAERILEGSDE